jgi:hypothetical protein
MSAAFTAQMIVDQLGDPDGTLALQIDAFWAAYNDGRSNFLVYLYTKREGIQILLGSLRSKVTKTVGPLKIQYSDQLIALDTMLANVNADIVRAEKQRASSGVASGVLTNNAVEPPPNVLGPDRNDSRFLGSPYPRRRVLG